MGYYVHNKYDKASIDGLSTTGAGHTIVDYYGDYNTYKYLDTSKGFGIVYDTLDYVTPNTTTGEGMGDDTASHLNFASSIVIKRIMRGINTATSAGVTVILENDIDPTKTFVFLSSKNTTNVQLNSVNSNNIVVSAANNVSFSWQALEFK